MDELLVESVECFVFKDTGHTHLDNAVESIPGTDYHLDRFGTAYSANLESVLVKVTAENGLHGWGEVQAPVAPEVPATLIERLLGPMVLGEDALGVERIRDRLYRSMSVRGQVTGFMIDAVSGLDIALWDLRGKALDTSVSTLLGGRRRESLSTYHSGLRADTIEEQGEMAREAFAEGFDAVKVYVNRDPETEVDRLAAIREEVGDEARILTDLFWAYSAPEAIALGREFERLGVEWIESPLATEDLPGHERVARSLDLSIAVGEPLRTAATFRQWFDRGALNIAQPDVGRTGLTEGKRIADLAATDGIPVAPHLGGSLGLAMAATWHLSAAIPNFHVQEHQAGWFETTNEFLDPQLELRDGRVQVPTGPGLGIDVDEDALAPFVVETRSCER